MSVIVYVDDWYDHSQIEDQPPANMAFEKSSAEAILPMSVRKRRTAADQVAIPTKPPEIGFQVVTCNMHTECITKKKARMH